MINHVVVIRLKSDVSQAQRDSLLEGMRKLVELDLAASYRFGADAGMGSGNNGDLALVATFEDEDSFKAYLAHDAHMELVGELQSLADDLAVVQFR